MDEKTTLTFLSKQHAYFQFDLFLTLFIQQFNFAWFDSLMRTTSTVTNLQWTIVAVVIISGFAFLKRQPKAALMIVISTVGAHLLSYNLKMLVGRPRPDPDLINQVGQYIRSDSFPSGHVLITVGLYGFLLYLVFTQFKKNLLRQFLMVAFSLLIFLVGLSRIYLGAHWFSDVLGAYLIGFLWLSLVIYIYHKL